MQILLVAASQTPSPPLLWSGQNSDSQNALEDLTHLEFLAHLRKTPASAALFDRLNHNGVAAAYGAARHDDLPPAIWSPGAQRRSPEQGGEPHGKHMGRSWKAFTVWNEDCV